MLSLAFAAFNAPGFADFVIEAPMPAVSPDAADESSPLVYHYDKLISLESRNRLFAL